MSQWKIDKPSPEKLAANQANAQLSTGPKTPEGKGRSAQNSLKHGLTTRELVIRPEEQPAFDELHAGYLSDLQPQGIVEIEMFNAIVHAAWNLRRIRTLEAQSFDGTTDPLLDVQNEAKLDRLSRYHRRFESTFHRSLRLLRSLQSDRSLRSAPGQSTGEALPPLADPRKALSAERTQENSLRNAFDKVFADMMREDDQMLARHRARRMRNEPTAAAGIRSLR